MLEQHAYTMPIWLAAQSPQDDGSPFVWMSGQPMDYQPWIAAATSQPLKITEIQAKNKNSLSVGAESPDWIEVTNTSTLPIDLAGYHLRHNMVEGNQRYLAQEWLEPAKLPSEARMIEPGERRIILCAANKLQENGYARFNFSLEATAGGLHWCDPRGHVIQRFDTPWRKFPEDTALVLAADGQSWGWTSKPTPGTANSPVEDTFPAPGEGSPDKLGLVLHPAFSGRWSGNPQRFSKPALLRRRDPK